MTPRQARTARRAAERAARKQERKAANRFVFSPHSESPLQSSERAESSELVARVPEQPSDGFLQAAAPALSNGQVAAPAPSTRADINRANGLDEAAVLSEPKTQKNASTGPRTPEGKLASSRNSLKHGLASAQLIIPGEDPAAFDALLADLLDEHQPANATEQLLVQEMAQSYWLTQRAIRFQNQCFTPEGVNEKRLALFLRYQTTHERAFHKALNTLIRLKKDRALWVRFATRRPAPERAWVRFAKCCYCTRSPPVCFAKQRTG